MNDLSNSFRSGPDDHGHFGIFGGRYVAETLMPLILEVERAYDAAKADPSFQAELDDLSLGTDLASARSASLPWPISRRPGPVIRRTSPTDHGGKL